MQARSKSFTVASSKHSSRSNTNRFDNLKNVTEHTEEDEANQNQKREDLNIDV